MIKAAKIGPRSLDQNISAHILVQCHNILRETIHVTFDRQTGATAVQIELKSGFIWHFFSILWCETVRLFVTSLSCC